MISPEVNVKALSKSDAERIARLIYDGKLKPEDLDAKLLNEIAQQFHDALIQGYGNPDAQLSSQDKQFLAHLEENIYGFSIAKTFHELKAINDLLTSDEKLVTFADFLKKAIQISEVINVNYLKTEYIFAVAAAQNASQWKDFEKTKEIFSKLKYKTAGDGRVREAHKKLNDVLKPFNDPFWNIYYPPNGWGCRCEVIQTGMGKITPDNKIEFPKIDKMFRVNLAKQGLIFPPEHPYYSGVNQDIFNHGRLMINKSNV